MIGTFIKYYIPIMTAVITAGPTACRPFLTATLTLTLNLRVARSRSLAAHDAAHGCVPRAPRHTGMRKS